MSFSLFGTYGSYKDAQEAIMNSGAPMSVKTFIDDASRSAFRNGAASPSMKCVAVKIEASGHVVRDENSWGVSYANLKVEPVFVKK